MMSKDELRNIKEEIITPKVEEIVQLPTTPKVSLQVDPPTSMQDMLDQTADAIREVEGSTDLIPPTDFPERIKQLGGGLPENPVPWSAYTLLQSGSFRVWYYKQGNIVHLWSDRSSSGSGGTVLIPTLHRPIRDIVLSGVSWDPLNNIFDNECRLHVATNGYIYDRSGTRYITTNPTYVGSYIIGS